MRRSLLDGVDLGRVRAAARASGPGAMLLACLLDGGVFAHDPDDPHWDDRDRLFVGTRLTEHALGAALRRAGHPPDRSDVRSEPAGRALRRAAGAARISAQAGSPFRVYCLLDTSAYTDGRVWEAAVEAGAEAVGPIVALVVGAGAAPMARMFRAARWDASIVTEPDPAAVLAALDRALRGGARPAAVLVEEP